MGFEKGGSYGTFEGQQGFPQPSAPPLAGTYSNGGQQYPIVPGMSFSHSLLPATFVSRFEDFGVSGSFRAMSNPCLLSNCQGFRGNLISAG